MQVNKLFRYCRWLKIYFIALLQPAAVLFIFTVPVQWRWWREGGVFTLQRFKLFWVASAARSDLVWGLDHVTVDCLSACLSVPPAPFATPLCVSFGPLSLSLHLSLFPTLSLSFSLCFSPFSVFSPSAIISLFHLSLLFLYPSNFPSNPSPSSLNHPDPLSSL